MGVFGNIAGSVVGMTVCLFMFYRADSEATRLYNLQYSKKHDDDQRTMLLAKKKKQLQWLYGVCTLVFASIVIKNLIVLFGV